MGGLPVSGMYVAVEKPIEGLGFPATCIHLQRQVRRVMDLRCWAVKATASQKRIMESDCLHGGDCPAKKAKTAAADGWQRRKQTRGCEEPAPTTSTVKGDKLEK